MRGPFGEQLRRWRLQRRYTQMDLAAEAEVSTRHLSCLETGKASPSRLMTLTLAEVLDIPLDETNRLLSSAGFAPAFRNRGLDGSDAESVRAAVEFLLRRHHPYPAVVIDGGWNASCANGAYIAFSKRLASPNGSLEASDLDIDPEQLHMEPFADEPNVLLPLFDDQKLKPRVLNFPVFSAMISTHLRRAARDEPAALKTLEQIEEMNRSRQVSPTPLNVAPSVVIPLVLSVGGQELRLFTMTSMLASSADAVLSSLRIETLFPADEESRRRLVIK